MKRVVIFAVVLYLAGLGVACAAYEWWRVWQTLLAN